MTMKLNDIAVIGAGGIGSWFCLALERLILGDQIPANVTVTVYDNDIVERKNLRHQLFHQDELGLPKSKLMAVRHGFKCSLKRFGQSDLTDHTYFILCADNAAVRSLVYEHVLAVNTSGKIEKRFIDMRCEGRGYMVLTHMCDGDMLRATLGAKPESEQGYSCQISSDVVASRIQLGNWAVAPVGAQLLLDDWRGLEIPDMIVSDVVPGFYRKEVAHAA